ncbi:carboxymuconolactone decarboxylase family protein [Trujillonella endophytica]|uniref:4-carboxymuconolactone decarboxylase n=1 Tax=Trujillonella endophytica TaxID=673521 RepID=A0A1H8UV07_9ACTN|nr:carboxymuconolactone decarboxylase family protein [Trujillella endophytica]SEP06991.1 4-carboxymuconolactone decarboxylase [Trujillella endophytica]
MTTATTDDVYREVMTVDPPPAAGPDEAARREELFGALWSAPGLGRRERRWVTLVCVGFDTDQQAMDEHVYAALNSGDVSLEEMLEFILHFAVYCGWPKASRMEMVLREQWARIHTERGDEVPEWPMLANETLGDNDWEARLQRGEQEFRDVNLVPAPARNTPYQQAGILNFVFGHLWMRPGLTRRDRRFITVPCVGVGEAPMPILSHVGSALHSGDLTRPEMDEVVRQFTAYAGADRGAVLARAVEDDLLGQMLADR